MKRILGLTLAGVLWLGLAPAANAQFSLSIGNPYSGGFYGNSLGYGMLPGTSYYSSAYSGGYPGLTTYSSAYGGMYPGVAAYSPGYTSVYPGVSSYVVPNYGYRSYGYGPGYGVYRGYGGFGRGYYGGFGRGFGGMFR